jgi:hypothetical protein
MLNWTNSFKILSIIVFSAALSACSRSNSEGVSQTHNTSSLVSSLGSKCQVAGPPERLYPRQNLPANLQLVTTKYGQAHVKLGESTLEADHYGWASWWYPANKPDLYSGLEAPLVAYDTWSARALGRTTRAADFQKSRASGTGAENWEGYCSPRAYASVLEPMVSESVLVDGQCFSPAQLKGLLTMTYEKVSPEKWGGLYGQVYHGGDDDFKTDLYPEEFLRLAQVALGDHKQPILVDHDPGVEVWMDAVHKVFVKVQKGETDSTVKINFVVHSSKYTLSPAERAMDASTGLELSRGITTREYTAVLNGCWQGDDFVVSSGEWSGGSTSDHPDFAVQLPFQQIDLVEKQRGSFNTELNVTDIDLLMSRALDAESAGQFCKKTVAPAAL